MGRTGRDLQREIAYDPLPSQKRFHESEARFKGFSGPIGSGKSQALCQEAVRLSYLNPGRLGLLGAPTYPMLRDATQATLFEILDGSGIPYEHNKAENTLVMKDTRSRILFRPVDEFERLRGTNLAWFGLDELTYTQEESWLRLEGRLRDPQAFRLCGCAVWTPKGYDWVYRKFISDRVKGYDAILAPAFENRHLLDRIPDFYERLKGSYDEKFYEQEVLGEYLSMDGGRVYTAFDRGEHVGDLQVVPYLPLFWALDFNVDPMSSVIVQVAAGKVLVLGEIVLRHGTTQEACEEFFKRFPRHDAGVVVYGDASGYQQQTTGTSDYQMIRDYFMAHSTTPVQYRVPRSNPSVRERINLTNKTLRSAAGKIGLQVDRKCNELVKDFEQVCFKADSNQIDKDRDRLRTHLSDALGYGAHPRRRTRRTIMSLFIDGPASSLEDLMAQDSQLLDVASLENIDVNQKLALAQDELRLDLETMLDGSSSVGGLSGVYQPFWIARQPQIGNVVVTPALKLWLTCRALAMVYEDAYYSQLNDRYAAKRDQFAEREKRAREKLIQLGVGMTWHPLPRGATLSLTATAGTGLPDDTYYIAMAWVNGAGEEGSCGPTASMATTGSTLTVAPSTAPKAATGWNVYAGNAPDGLGMQNLAPIPVGQSWHLTGPAAGGRSPGDGQTANYNQPAPRVIQRG